MTTIAMRTNCGGGSIGPELAMGPGSWGWVERGYASTRRIDSEAALSKVQTPVFIVATDDDKLIGFDAIERAARWLPRGEVFIFGKEARHELLREEDSVRDLAIEAIDGFLDQIALKKDAPSCERTIRYCGDRRWDRRGEPRGRTGRPCQCGAARGGGSPGLSFDRAFRCLLGRELRRVDDPAADHRLRPMARRTRLSRPARRAPFGTPPGKRPRRSIFSPSSLRPGSMWNRRTGAGLESFVPGLRPEWSHGVYEPDCKDIDVAGLHAWYLAEGKRLGSELRVRARLAEAELLLRWLDARDSRTERRSPVPRWSMPRAPGPIRWPHWRASNPLASSRCAARWYSSVLRRPRRRPFRW